MLIPTEKDLVNEVLKTIPSPLWNTAAARLTNVGITNSEAENVLLPLASSYGIDAGFYEIGTSNMPGSSISSQEARFDRIVARGGPMMVSVPSGWQGASQGSGHIVVIQQATPGFVTYIDPRGGGIQYTTTNAAWTQYAGWSVYGGGYVIAPHKP